MTDTPDTGPDAGIDTPTDTGSDTGVSDTGPGSPQPARGGPHLGIAETIRATGISRTTLQRRLKAGEIPGAHHGPDGTWRIPMSGLIESGLLGKVTPPDPPVDRGPVAAARGPELERALVELEQLRAERDAALELADVHRQHAEALREALAALSRALPPAPDPAVSPPESPADPPVKRWWKRKR